MQENRPSARPIKLLRRSSGYGFLRSRAAALGWYRWHLAGQLHASRSSNPPAPSPKASETLNPKPYTLSRESKHPEKPAKRKNEKTLNADSESRRRECRSEARLCTLPPGDQGHRGPSPPESPDWKGLEFGVYRCWDLVSRRDYASLLFWCWDLGFRVLGCFGWSNEVSGREV